MKKSMKGVRRNHSNFEMGMTAQFNHVQSLQSATDFQTQRLIPEECYMRIFLCELGYSGREL